MQHFSVRERLGVAAAAGVVLMLGLGGWAYSRAGGDSGASKPAFAPVGANGLPASIEVVATGPSQPAASGPTSAIPATRTPTGPAVLVVHVTGEVRNPGVYKFKDGDRIADAIHAAGGFKDHADQEALNLADTLRDADQICVPILVKLSGPDATAERSGVSYTTPASSRRRRSPIVHGQSAAAAPAAPTSAEDSPGASAPDSSSAAPVALAAVPREPGRVLGRAAPQLTDADDAGDAASAGDLAAPPADVVAPPGLAMRGFSKKGRSASTRSSKGAKSAGKSAKFKNPGDGIVHLNSATASQLEQLPGVGPAMSGRIVEYRTQIGKFTDVSQLTDVKGIGEKKFAKMQPFLAL